jgi:hypothetical protein
MALDSGTARDSRINYIRYTKPSTVSTTHCVMPLEYPPVLEVQAGAR